MNAFRRLLRKRALERELDAEMAAHREEQVEALLESGMNEAEARLKAARRFGNVTALKETSRDGWGWLWAEQVARDVRYSLRVLSRERGFALTVILILALGTGMNTAIFSLIKSALLSRLPYPHPEQLVELWQVNSHRDLINVSGPDLQDWRKQSREFASLASFSAGEIPLSGSSFTSRRIQFAAVGARFFETVGVQVKAGHVFTAEEQRPGIAPTAILGAHLAIELFGNEKAAIGKTVRAQGLTFVVSGVLPSTFDFPAHSQIWLPNDFFGDDTARSAHNFQVIGRIRTGGTLGQAQQEMKVIADRLGRTYPDDKDYGIKVVSLYDSLTAPVRAPLTMLFAAVSLMLFLACLNIASLQLTRTTVRLREFALRSAVGAARSRLLMQLLTESLLLAIAGASFGFVFAAGGTRVITSFAPANLPFVATVPIDGGMLLFSAALAIGSAVGCGALPALLGSRVDLSEVLKDGQAQSTATPKRMQWARILIAGQIALTTVLLASASLLSKSYWQLSHVSTGLQPFGIITGTISWPTTDGNSSKASEVQRISDGILQGLRSDLRIESAALVQPLPIVYPGSDGDFEIAGRPLSPDPHQAPNAIYRLATPDYFRVVGIPLLKGHVFTAREQNANVQAAVVSHVFVQRYFPREEVLGHKVRFFGFDRKPQFMTIVGVVGDVREQGFDAPSFYPEVYGAMLQHADSILDASLVFRGPTAAIPFVTETIQKLSPETPVKLEPLSDVLGGTVARERFETLLLGCFSGFALLLAGVGVFGLLSFTVSQRINEIGIRIALGANRHDVMSLVLTQGTRLLVIGCSFGLIITLLVTRLLSSFLFATSAYDVPSLTAAMVCLSLTALAGCYLPAQRASRIDALAAIRHA